MRAYLRDFNESFNTVNEEGVSPRKKLRSALIILGFILMLFTIHLYAAEKYIAATSISEPAKTEVVQKQSQAVPEIASAKTTAKKVAKTKCSLSKSYPASIQQWCTTITKYAKKNNIDPNLVAAVMLQESGGNPTAISQSGAVGLLQIMPRDGIAASFQCINGPCFQNRPSTDELINPEFNVKYGTEFLASLLEKHGNIKKALVAYGPLDNGSYSEKVLGIYKANKGK